MPQSDAPEIEVVLAWHAALNAGEVERVLALSTDDVEVGGPRGAGRGANLLRDWIDRARVQLEPREWQARDGALIVEEVAQWQTPEGSRTEPQTAASVFRVKGGKVDSVVRYDDVASAMAALDNQRQG